MRSDGHESASQRVLGRTSSAARYGNRRKFLFDRAARTLVLDVEVDCSCSIRTERYRGLAVWLSGGSKTRCPVTDQ